MSAPTIDAPTSLTAPNRTIEAANGVTYAYRRFGDAERGAPPVLFLQHFRGNLDNWDPALVDRIAARREVILFDNAGVGGSSGTVRRTFTAMAHDALAFVDALGLGRSTSSASRSAASWLRSSRSSGRSSSAGSCWPAPARRAASGMHGWPPDVPR